MSWPVLALSAILAAADTPPPAAPESYLGVQVAVPTFSEDDGAADPDLAPGLTVTSVVENSPAAAAGLQAGDVIVRVLGERLRTPQHLEGMVAALAVGTSIPIAARRGAEVLELHATTVARLEPRKAPEVRQFLESKRLGVAVATLTGDEARAASLPPGDGVRILRHLAGGPAAAAGLQPGDVLAGIHGTRIHGGEDFLAIAKGLEPGAEVRVEVLREGKRLQVPVKVRTPESYVSKAHFPLIVIYENDPRKDETTFGLILNIFKYTRKEDRRTYRFLWFISFSTGTNEELKEVAE
ncbi:MAG TPA: PDZ domain-containing protein [Planctomycetota bacterium]|nr:PDZ domain-containing protein [Planctomycetota bacterium]